MQVGALRDEARLEIDFVSRKPRELAAPRILDDGHSSAVTMFALTLITATSGFQAARLPPPVRAERAAVRFAPIMREMDEEEEKYYEEYVKKRGTADMEAAQAEYLKVRDGPASRRGRRACNLLGYHAPHPSQRTPGPPRPHPPRHPLARRSSRRSASEATSSTAATAAAARSATATWTSRTSTTRRRWAATATASPTLAAAAATCAFCVRFA